MKKIFKRLLSKEGYYYRLFSYLYHFRKKYWHPAKVEDLYELLFIYASQNQTVNFIQVGSNDGISNDPLYNFINRNKWTGVCIEPIPENFEKLRLTHKNNSDIQLINAAVGANGEIVLYFINAEKAKALNIHLPDWYSQLASFDKDLVVADISGTNKHEIVDEIKVKSISFKTLLSLYHIQTLGILHIDTEGADWQILSTFPFKTTLPDIVIFEHNHISLDEYKLAVDLLKSKGYKLFQVQTDTFAYAGKYNFLFKNSRKKAAKF